MGTQTSCIPNSCQAAPIVLRRGLLCRHICFNIQGPKDAPELVPHIQDIMDATMLFSQSEKSGRLPTRLIAKKVLRCTNMEIYARFAAVRDRTKKTRQGDIQPVNVKTSDSSQKMQQFRAGNYGGKETTRLLDPDINEVYLWHGTSYEAVRHIFSEDFNTGYKAHAGLYGNGLYFAESCAKADEYSHCERHEQGWFSGGDALHEGSSICAMLLCRVVLGKVKVVEQCGNHGDSLNEQGYDSLIGDREHHRREFIISSADAVYPELGVFYVRHYD